MVAHPLSNLAHLLERTATSPAGKRGVAPFEEFFFPAFVAHTLRYLINGEQLLSAGITKGDVILFRILGLLQFHVQPSASYDSSICKDVETGFFI
jgi:hypothetical protein